ncbi:unnamed protein product [Pylaiella littoralis]
MTEPMGIAVDGGDGIVQGEKKNGLQLAKCEELPRLVLESAAGTHILAGVVAFCWKRSAIWRLQQHPSYSLKLTELDKESSFQKWQTLNPKQGRISEPVFERMNFLWRASNCLRLSSPAVSRIYSDQLRKLCAGHEAQLPAAAMAAATATAGRGIPLLPEWVSGSLCISCGCVLTPGLNCRVRVRHRSLASPSVRKATTKTKVQGKKKKKCLNEVVTTCLMCGGINARGGAERGARDKKRKRKGRGDEGQVADIAEAGRETPQGKKRTRTPTNLRGNFIPLGEGSSSRASSTPRTATTTTAHKQNPRNLSPRVAQPSPNTNGSSRNGASTKSSSNSSRSGGGDGGGGNGNGTLSSALRTPARQGGPAAAQGTGASQPASERGGGGGVGRTDQNIGSVGGGGGVKGGVGGDAEIEPPALSLLERIRRDAKKKRRQDAAAAAAAAK